MEELEKNVPVEHFRSICSLASERVAQGRVPLIGCRIGSRGKGSVYPGP